MAWIHEPGVIAKYFNSQAATVVRDRPPVGFEVFVPACSCGWEGVWHGGAGAENSAGIRAEMHVERMLEARHPE